MRVIQVLKEYNIELSTLEDFLTSLDRKKFTDLKINKTLPQDYIHLIGAAFMKDKIVKLKKDSIVLPPSRRDSAIVSKKSKVSLPGERKKKGEFKIFAKAKKNVLARPSKTANPNYYKLTRGGLCNPR